MTVQEEKAYMKGYNDAKRLFMQAEIDRCKKEIELLELSMKMDEWSEGLRICQESQSQ